MAKTSSLEPWDILVGLRPGLAQDLANLVGSTEEDLQVSFQVMPWGDRATLAGYGVIELERQSSGRGRVSKVNPEALELVNFAAEMAETNGFGADESGFVDRSDLLASAAVPLVEVTSSDAPAEVTCVPGIVEHVESLGRLDRVHVRVPVTMDSVGESGAKATKTIEVVAAGLEIRRGWEVTLCYSAPDDRLSHPTSMHVLYKVDPEGVPSV